MGGNGMKRRAVLVAILVLLGGLSMVAAWRWNTFRQIEKESRLEALRGIIDFGDASDARDLVTAEPTIVDSFFEDGMSPLLLACQKGRHQVIRVLLENGANPNIKNKLGNTPLTLGTDSSDIDTVRVLLEFHADPDQPSLDGLTPLHWASVYGEVDIAKLLLDHGASVDSKSSEGTTPLLRCLLNGKQNVSEVCTLLMSHGADPHATNEKGMTPLAVARKKGITLPSLPSSAPPVPAHRPAPPSAPK